jgi:hypothetical protein
MTDTQRIVHFTYDEENGNILQNVKEGDKIYFRAIGTIKEKQQILYKKTMILEKMDYNASPNIKNTNFPKTYMILNSKEHSGVHSHISNNDIEIDYYLTVIENNGGELYFSDNIVFTRFYFNNLHYKDFELNLKKSDILNQGDEDFMSKIKQKLESMHGDASKLHDIKAKNAKFAKKVNITKLLNWKPQETQETPRKYNKNGLDTRRTRTQI